MYILYAQCLQNIFLVASVLIIIVTIILIVTVVALAFPWVFCSMIFPELTIFYSVQILESLRWQSKSQKIFWIIEKKAI